MTVTRTTQMKGWIQNQRVPREQHTNPTLIVKGIVFHKDLPVPKLQKSQQVLIKVNRCTMNPNDLLHLNGIYSPTETIPYPRKMGFEGSGVVIESTASFYLPQKGTRVAFYAEQGGAFGEFVVCDAQSCIPIDDTISMERAAGSLTNPLSAIVMVDEAKALGHSIIVNTAAAGGLGRLLYKYATQQGLEVICIVRKESQVQLLQEMGAKYVFNSTSPTFETDLGNIMKQTNCTLAYDCLAGDSMPNTILKVAPPHMTLKIYGSMVSDSLKVDVNALSHGKQIGYFLVGESMSKMWIWTVLRTISKVKHWMTKDEEEIKVHTTFPLEELPQAIAEYAGDNKTKGKIQVIASSSVE